MNAAPSFHLAACPICSSWAATARPFWKLARHTSKSRGRDCFHWMGCSHAMEIVKDPQRIYDDENEWANVEAVWSHAVEALFASKTEKWAPSQAARFAESLLGKYFLPGATASLNLTPEGPAQPTDRDKENHG